MVKFILGVTNVDIAIVFCTVMLISSVATWLYIVVLSIEIDKIRTTENYVPRHDIDRLLWALRIIGLPVMLLIALLGLILELSSKLFRR